MITSVQIQGLRGIRVAQLHELTPLTVLVGPNGCGKSTLLDALLICVGGLPGDGIGKSIKRRTPSEPAANWVFNSASDGAVRIDVATTRAVTNGTANVTVKMKWLPEMNARVLADAIAQTSRAAFKTSELFGAVESNVSMLLAGAQRGADPLRSNTLLFNDNDWFETTSGPLPDYRSYGPVELVDLRGAAHVQTKPLHDVLSGVIRKGAKRSVIELLSELLPAGFDDILVATDRGVPSVHLSFTSGSVPLSQAGDGIRGLARLALALGAHEGGTVLVEEPEVHQHPAAIRQTARALAAASKRGIQVIVTTHSLDLIDGLIEETTARQALDDLSVFRLALEGGQLKSVTTRGERLRLVRQEIEAELR